MKKKSKKKSLLSDINLSTEDLKDEDIIKNLNEVNLSLEIIIKNVFVLENLT